MVPRAVRYSSSARAFSSDGKSWPVLPLPDLRWAQIRGRRRHRRWSGGGTGAPYAVRCRRPASPPRAARRPARPETCPAGTVRWCPELGPPRPGRLGQRHGQGAERLGLHVQPERPRRRGRGSGLRRLELVQPVPVVQQRGPAAAQIGGVQLGRFRQRFPVQLERQAGVGHDHQGGRQRAGRLADRLHDGLPGGQPGGHQAADVVQPGQRVQRQLGAGQPVRLQPGAGPQALEQGCDTGRDGVEGLGHLPS